MNVLQRIYLPTITTEKDKGFHFLTISESSAINIFVQISLDICNIVFVLYGRDLEVKLLGYRIYESSALPCFVKQLFKVMVLMILP